MEEDQKENQDENEENDQINIQNIDNIQDLESATKTQTRKVQRAKSILTRGDTIQIKKAKTIDATSKEQQKAQIKLLKAKKRLLEKQQKRKDIKRQKKGRFTKENMKSKIQKFEINDKKDPTNKKFVANENFQGPEVNRKKTNTFWTYIFVALNIGFLFFMIWTIVQGNPKRLFHGFDFRGELCGVDRYSEDNSNNKPYLYYVYPEKDERVGICVQECPKVNGPQVCLYRQSSKRQDGITQTNLCYRQFQTEQQGRYCIPTEPNNRRIIDDNLNKWRNVIKNIASDVYLTLDLIILGGFLSLGIVILTSRLFTQVFILINYHKLILIQVQWIKRLLYFSIGTMIFSFIIIILACIFEYQKVLDNRCKFIANKNIFTSYCLGWKGKGFFWAALFFAIFGILYILMIINKRRQIPKAITILKAANQTTSVLKQLKIIPFYTLIKALVICILFLVILFQAFSVGEFIIIETNHNAIFGDKIRQFQYNSTHRYIVLYQTFMFAYWILIIFGFQDLIISLCICIWYFTKRKETVDIPLKRVYKEVLKYHLGTISLISLTNSIFSSLKGVLAFIRRQLGKNNKEKTLQYSTIIRFSQAVCISCLIIYEKLLRYISKASFVQVAMWSDSYYIASKKAYFLTFRSHDIIQDSDRLQQFVNFQLKIMCSIIPATLVYIYIIFVNFSFVRFSSLNDVYTPFTSFIITFIFSYILSSIYLRPYDMTIKTIFQCYLMDSEMFIGEKRYAEQFIRELMDTINDEKDNLDAEAKFHGKKGGRQKNETGEAEDSGSEEKQEESKSGSSDYYSSSYSESEDGSDYSESEDEDDESDIESEDSAQAELESNEEDLEDENLLDEEEEADEEEENSLSQEEEGSQSQGSQEQSQSKESKNSEEQQDSAISEASDISEFDEDGNKIRKTRKGQIQQDNIEIVNDDLDQFEKK